MSAHDAALPTRMIYPARHPGLPLCARWNQEKALLFVQVLDGRAVRLDQRPEGLDSPERLRCTPTALVDFGVDGYLHRATRRLYAAASDFGGNTTWYELPASTSRRFARVEADLATQVQGLPESAFSFTSPPGRPELLDSLALTPAALREATRAYFGNDGRIFVSKGGTGLKPKWAALQ